ncbi:MAG: DMT family transporter [Patescibacteria group bacterium]|jgi:drug/metabolite transporter (DMT)-like permease
MWILTSLGAAILWGLTYVLNEKMFERISVATTLTIGCGVSAIILGIYSLVRGTLKTDLVKIADSKSLLILVIVSSLSFALADWLIASSVSSKNATLATIIEISYPIFVALFAYVLYREVQITALGFIGGAIIFIGVLIVFISTK